MKCGKCGNEMRRIGLVPRLGRKVLGKQYYKYQCQCGEIRYVRPN